MLGFSNTAHCYREIYRNMNDPWHVPVPLPIWKPSSKAVIILQSKWTDKAIQLLPTLNQTGLSAGMPVRLWNGHLTSQLFY